MKKYAAAAFFIGVLNQPAFADLSFHENWSNSDVSLADPSQYSCSGQGDLIGAQCNIPSNKKYGSLNDVNPACASPGPNSCYEVETANNRLRYHGYSQIVNGNLQINFELISRQTFNKNTYISAEAVISAACQPSTGACFSGLALFNGEGNYREIAYANLLANPTHMEIQRLSNCEQRAFVNPTSGQPVLAEQGSFHKLRLDYYGQVTGGKWVYYVDDIVQWISNQGVTTEPAYVQPACNPPSTGGVDQVELANDPHLALYLLGNVRNQTTSSNDGYVGAVSVFTGLYPIEERLTQSDGLGLTSSTWIAQLALMGSGGTAAQNITMAQLFLIDGQDYIVEAHLNNGGIPGELINSAPYKATGTGLQYVPLWVPSNHQNLWIVVKGRSGNAQIGTSAHGAHSADGTFLYTVNGGTNWSPMPRELSFGTYTRK